MENRTFFHVYLVSLTLSFGSHLSLFCFVPKFKLSADIHIHPLVVLSLERLLQGEINFPLAYRVNDSKWPPITRDVIFSFMFLFPGDPEDLYVTNILYEREVTKREVTGAEVAELVWKLCLAHSASYEVSCIHSLCFLGRLFMG